MITTLVRTDRPTVVAAAAAKSSGSGAGAGAGDGVTGRGTGAGTHDYLDRLDLVPQEALLSDMRSLVKQFADTVKVRVNHDCHTHTW